MNQYAAAVSRAAPTLAPTFAYAGTRPSTDCGTGGAISVPHLRRELEAKELLVCLGVDDLRAWEELHFGEVVARLETAFELADVFSIAGEPGQPHGACGLQIRGEPEPARIPVRVVDFGGVVTPHLLELVAVGRRAAARGEDVRELEQRGGRSRSGSLQLLNRVFAVA